MFNHDRVSGKKDDSQRGEPRSLNPSISVGGSAGAHPAAPSQAASEKSSLVSADSGGSQLVVGAGIKMTGVEVTDCDTLIGTYIVTRMDISDPCPTKAGAGTCEWRYGLPSTVCGQFDLLRVVLGGATTITVAAG